MPSSLENAIARNQALTDSGQKVYSAELPPAEAPLPPPLPTISGLPIRGVLPSSMTESTDFANTTKQGGVPMRSGIFPPQAQPLTTTKTTVVVGAASSSAPAATLALSTNNMTNPSQSKLNFIAGAGMTITSDASGNEVFSAETGAEVLGPGFIFYNTPTSNVAISNYISSTANNVGGFLFYLPTGITTSRIQFYVVQGDASNTYDVGLYGPFTGAELTLPLLANIGPTTFGSSSVTATTSWLQGAVSLTPGYYFINWTSSAAGFILQLQGLYASQYLYDATSSTVTTGSTLPGMVNVPLRDPTQLSTGVGGDNRPNWFNFTLS